MKANGSRLPGMPFRDSVSHRRLMEVFLKSDENLAYLVGSSQVRNRVCDGIAIAQPEHLSVFSRVIGLTGLLLIAFAMLVYGIRCLRSLIGSLRGTGKPITSASHHS